MKTTHNTVALCALAFFATSCASVQPNSLELSGSYLDNQDFAADGVVQTRGSLFLERADSPGIAVEIGAQHADYGRGASDIGGRLGIRQYFDSMGPDASDAGREPSALRTFYTAGVRFDNRDNGPAFAGTGDESSLEAGVYAGIGASLDLGTRARLIIMTEAFSNDVHDRTEGSVRVGLNWRL